MPKFYFERIVHRYVREYYVVEAIDEEEADEKYYDGDHEQLGSVIGNRISYLDDADEMIEPNVLPSKYDVEGE